MSIFIFYFILCLMFSPYSFRQIPNDIICREIGTSLTREREIAKSLVAFPNHFLETLILDKRDYSEDCDRVHYPYRLKVVIL